jgi:hypothetical protein
VPGEVGGGGARGVTLALVFPLLPAIWTLLVLCSCCPQPGGAVYARYDGGVDVTVDETNGVSSLPIGVALTSNVVQLSVRACACVRACVRAYLRLACLFSCCCCCCYAHALESLPVYARVTVCSLRADP